jgi:hypothetical protein
MNIWKGLLPKQPNAFTIPEKSAVVEGDRRTFPKVLQRRPRNMNPITLPGSSKFLPPEMMNARKAD